VLRTVTEASLASSVEHQTEQQPAGGDVSEFAPVLTAGRVVTALLVGGPVVALAVFLPLGWGKAFGLWDIVMAVVLFTFTGFGISIGFHRLFTHHSFKANRALKILCAVAGSMALEGSVISWVAIHRRHHMFGDQPGDPHSPYRYGSGVVGSVRGFLWSHVGWLFAADSTDTRRFAPDLYRDRDLVVVDRLFPVLAIASLVLPFAIGWAVYGTLVGALTALLWAGLVRMAVLHHVTWSINSVCHLWGRRPFTTSDRSTNVASLALVSFGESWHNFHHAAPSSARHGALRHQFDPSARVISWFERAGWATKVRWPSAAQIAALAKTGPGEHPELLRYRRSLEARVKTETP
jgi:stearoyl-CoA desaturase (delta-9 desaturase)